MMAERVGFEPTVWVTQTAALGKAASIRPLSHLSILVKSTVSLSRNKLRDSLSF